MGTINDLKNIIKKYRLEDNLFVDSKADILKCVSG